jgi:hypothetical protein
MSQREHCGLGQKQVLGFENRWTGSGGADRLASGSENWTWVNSRTGGREAGGEGVLVPL